MRAQNSIVSPTRRNDGSTGKIHVPRPTNSLRMSFWAVPRSELSSKPRLRAIAKYIAMIGAAAPLMVSETVILFRSMSANASSMSASVSTAMPTRPTSPDAIGSSESSPHWVGRSNATLSPVWPFSISQRNRSWVSAAVPKPEYCRMVHGRVRYIFGWMPRV